MSDERIREDELVSAYLDNEATAAEIAEVEADDALMARVEELRALRDAVAEPVPPLSPDERDQMIGMALGVADAGARTRLEAKVVPLHRPQRLLLAMAAAVVLLGAVVGAGLIASRGGDDSEEMATEALTMADDAAPAEMAGEEPAAEMEMADAAEPTAEEEPMAEAAPMPEDESRAEPATDAMAAAQAEAAMDDAMAAEEAAQEAAEAAMEAAAAEAAPAATTTIATATTVASPEAVDSDDPPSEQVVDLGALESLESLFENIGASWSAALEDGALADSGACSSAVHERALESSAETLRSFVATVGTDDPLTYDARFARRDDGTSVIIYASPPDCEIGVHELPGS